MKYLVFLHFFSQALKKESSSRPSAHELDETIREKDEIIEDLRHEGEEKSSG